MQYIMLGFNSVKGFLSSLVGAKVGKILILFSISVSTILAIINDFIDLWIFKPATVLWVVILSYFLDWGLHVYLALKAKPSKFQSSKAQRIIPKTIVVILLLSFLYHAQIQFSQAYGSDGMRIALRHFRLTVAFYISIINILSFVATAGRNKLIDNKVVKYINKYVDTHKEQLLNKQEDDKLHA